MIEQIYNEPDEISVRSNMDKFWQSWQELSIDPSNNAARDAVVEIAQIRYQSDAAAHFKAVFLIGLCHYLGSGSHEERCDDYSFA